MRFLRPILLALMLALGPAAHAVEVDLQWLKGTQFLDSNGDPVAGGKLFIQDAGTTGHRTTYSDAAGTIANSFTSGKIILDSAGRLTESVYIPVGAWKLTFTDASDVTIYTEDNIEGAVDTSAFTVSSAKPELPVVSRTSNYTVVTDDLGKCINANPTGGAFTVTLISAATAGDGKTLCVRHVGTSNQVTIAAVSNQTIDRRDTFVLSNSYDSALLVSDGANWHIVAQAAPAGALQFTVADRLTAPPSSPAAGAWYIVNGTPTGDWSSFADEDIVRAAGDGGWHKFTPPTDSGWMAYLQDENLLLQFRDSAWVDLSNITAPNSSDLGLFEVKIQTGSSLGAATTNAWTNWPTTGTGVNTITGASYDNTNKRFTLPAGNYMVIGHLNIFESTGFTARLQDNGDSSTDLLSAPGANSSTNETAPAMLVGYLSPSSETTYNPQYYATSSNSNFSDTVADGEEEVYGRILIIDISSLQGPQGSAGPQGAQGNDGLAGFQYDFDADTSTGSDGDSGDVRLNSATLSSVTEIAIDDNDRNAVDISAYLVTVDDSTTTGARSTIVLQAPGTPSDIAIYTISGACTDEAGWVRCPVTHVASNGTFSEDEDVNLAFSRTGDKGDTGSTGSQGIAGPTLAAGFTYDATTTDSDPGSGNFRLNNATPSSATKAFFDNDEIGGTDVSAHLDTWDDSGNTSNRGTLILTDASDSTAFYIFTVTGSVVDDTGYRDVTIAYVAGAGTMAGEVHALFVPRGPPGSGLSDVVDDTTPQLGGQLDVNGNAVGDGTRELLTFTEDASAVNQLNVENKATGSGPILSSAGDDANIDLNLHTKGSGSVVVGATTDVNGNEVILDADADTSVTADTDDTIDIRVAGADDFQITANTFNALSGSTIQEAGVDISPIGQHTVSVPASALTSRTSNGCASGSTETTTNKVMLESCDFDAAADEFAQFSIKMPKGWNEGTVVMSFDWFANATTGNVVWAAQGVCFGDDDSLDAAFGTAQTVTDGAGSAADDNMGSAETSAITLAGSPAAEDRCVFQVYRDADNGSDTLSVDAELLEVKLHLTMDAATDD